MDSKTNKPKPSANGSTATIKPSTTDEENSDNESIGNVMSQMSVRMERRDLNFGYVENVASTNSLEISTRASITEDSIPRWYDNEETAAVSNKTCTICNKGRMSQDRLANHLHSTHDVLLCSIPILLGDYIHASEEWQETLEDKPPDPLPCDWDSEKEQLISENKSQNENDSDDEKPRMFQLQAHKSSSADSSSEESENKPNRKNKNKRLGSLKTDITAVKSEIEVVNENLGYIEGKIVAFEDGMENIGKDVSQANKEMNLIKIEQRSCSESI